MINFSQLSNDLAASGLTDWFDYLNNAIQNRLASYTHGELHQWETMLAALPLIKPTEIDLVDQVKIGTQQDLNEQLTSAQQSDFISALKTLHPWRKGPFHLFDTHIDTEWRSDWKWERIKQSISSLKGRNVLDVGCGNGYHCWRMRGAGAKTVIGIDPSQKFLAQFAVIKKYLANEPVHLLPLGIEDMIQKPTLKGFDSVFSMGVLYHRKSPINHLLELKQLLAPNGELILETLIIDGDENQVLVPQDRYAQMRNVWFLPSTKALELWLARCGFKQIRTIDVNQTSIQEQRATDWMTFHSLENYLDPKNQNLTIEGYPAPKRAVVIAKL
ncbi:tRNA 5-methoxyuridine(34)/uridine 5-oxyacetic acid(34) synthase CmoB [Aliikangiella sp. IMCC44653]